MTAAMHVGFLLAAACACVTPRAAVVVDKVSTVTVKDRCAPATGPKLMSVVPPRAVMVGGAELVCYQKAEAGKLDANLSAFRDWVRDTLDRCSRSP